MQSGIAMSARGMVRTVEQTEEGDILDHCQGQAGLAEGETRCTHDHFSYSLGARETLLEQVVLLPSAASGWGYNFNYCICETINQSTDPVVGLLCRCCCWTGHSRCIMDAYTYSAILLWWSFRVSTQIIKTPQSRRSFLYRFFLKLNSTYKLIFVLIIHYSKVKVVFSLSPIHFSRQYLKRNE